jgi:hypothetical protein
MNRFARYNPFIFMVLITILVSTAGCGALRIPVGPRTDAFVIVINDSPDLLEPTVDGVRLGRISAGHQLDHTIVLSVSTNHTVIWYYPDSRLYRPAQTYSPDDIFREHRDLYGDPVDGVIRASGHNERLVTPTDK